jgi:hypothetical protein
MSLSSPRQPPSPPPPFHRFSAMKAFLFRPLRFFFGFACPPPSSTLSTCSTLEAHFAGKTPSSQVSIEKLSLNHPYYRNNVKKWALRAPSSLFLRNFQLSSENCKILQSM